MFQPPSETFPSQDAAKASTPSLIGADRILEIIRREKLLIAASVAVCLALAVTYIALATPLYTATSSILIDTKRGELLSKDESASTNMIDPGYVESQVQILTSYNLARAVVQKLRLVDDPEFNDSVQNPLISSFSHLFGLLFPNKSDHKVDIEQKVVQNVQNAFKVDRQGVTYVLNVSFASSSPTKSAAIANELVEQYFVGSLEARYSATRRASEWLQARSGELRQQAADADRAVETFKREHNLVGTNRGLMSDQQLSDLNSQLVQAQASTAEAKARLDRIGKISERDVSQVTVSDALNNAVITRLRAQYLDMSAKYSDLSSRYGSQHQAVLDIANKMAELRKNIWDEIQRIASAYKSDFEIATSREVALQASLNSAVVKSQDSSQLQVQLRTLESAGDAYRSNYNSFLDKQQQVSQQESYPITDARVINSAVPPDRKSSPKTLLLLLGATIGGLCVGVGSGFARSAMDDTFRTSEQTEIETGLRCLGVLPKVGSEGLLTTRSRGKQSAELMSRAALDVVFNKPFSRYAEVTRGLKVSLDREKPKDRGLVVGVVSALPREGKTTVAINLARSIAMAGHKVCLVDCDFHMKTCSRALASEATTGLLQALMKAGEISSFVTADPATSLDVLPIVSEERIHNSVRLAGSQEMRDIFSALTKKYEYVIVDLPPMMSVNDARVLSGEVDRLLYVIRWGWSSRRAVKEAIGSDPEVEGKIIGTVLNAADVRALREIERYKGNDFGMYYS